MTAACLVFEKYVLDASDSGEEASSVPDGTVRAYRGLANLHRPSIKADIEKDTIPYSQSEEDKWYK